MSLERWEERVIDELDAVDVAAMYDDMLRECHDLGGMLAHCDAARLIEREDRTAYHCGFIDYFDSLSRDHDYVEVNEQLYDRRDVEAIQDECEAEDEAEREANDELTNDHGENRHNDNL